MTRRLPGIGNTMTEPVVSGVRPWVLAVVGLLITGSVVGNVLLVLARRKPREVRMCARTA